MNLFALVFSALLGTAHGFSAVARLPASSLMRATSITMFEEEKNQPSITSITRSQQVGADRVSGIVVTDGTGSFYASRTLFPMLNNFGRYASIVAYSDDVVTSKKALITREARYSGLLDVLECKDGAMADAMAGADAWLAVNADEVTFPAQLDAAKAAGVKRVFCLLTGDGPTTALANVDALEKQLGASGMEYTVMRTGSLVKTGSGGGLKLAALDVPVCDDVSKEDVFRFITEALTLPEASNRMFSLCPTEGTVDKLKQMRLCGYERREEVQLLLKGLIAEEAAVELSEEEQEEQKELVMRSEAELAAEREEELRTLLAKARQRGIETQQRLKYEEAEKEAHRKEQEKYYASPDTTVPDVAPTDLPSGSAAPADEATDDAAGDDKPDGEQK